MFVKIFELKKKNVLLILGMLVAFILSIFKSFYLAQFIDTIASDSLRSDKLVAMLAFLLGIILITIVANVILMQYLPMKLTLDKSVQLTKRVANGILNLSQKEYSSKENGYYINLITSSAFTYGDLYSQLNIQLIGYALCIIALIAFTFTFNASIAICFIVYIPIYALALKIPNQRISSFQKDGLSTQDTFLGETKKIVENKKSINIARADNYFYNLYNEKANRYLNFVTKFRWYSILSTNIPQILSAILLIGTMWLSLQFYIRGKFNLTYILLIFQLTQVLQEPLDGFFQILSYSSINEVHIERLNHFLKEKKASSGFDTIYKNINTLVNIPNGTFFADSDNNHKLFSTTDFTLPKKGLILIKGKNGSGKSMFINYLTGFSDVEKFQGEIHADTALSDVPYMTNPILLVKGTLEDNMFGRKMDPELLKLLGIHFQDKRIDDNSINLSFGEQQKLNLLRVLSEDSELYILDEPFTNLDKETIKNLSTYLSHLALTRCIVAIVHSNELDSYADAIVEISDGKMLLTEYSVCK